MKKTEILWESEGKNHNGDSFFVVKKAREYYVYGERVGVDSIAFVLYDRNIDKFAMIYESKPPMDEKFQKEVRMWTAFGGSVDMDATKKEIAKVEVLEETGYEAPLNRVHFIGETLVSTQMNQMCHSFLVDVTDIEKTSIAEYEKELSDHQASKDPNEFIGNKVEWFSMDEVLDKNDWKSIFIITKAKQKGLI